MCSSPTERSGARHRAQARRSRGRQTVNDDRWGWAVNCGLSDRRTRRSGALSQRWRDRKLCRRCTGLRQSGKKRFSGSPTIPFGNARLRKALWMVVLNAVRCNPWLRQYYERLRAAGKPGKVAVIAAMRKLLVAVWSVGTHRRPFVPIMPAPITKNV